MKGTRNILIILFIVSFIGLISALDKTSIEFIRTSCGSTSYPALCFSSLSAQAGAIHTSPKILARTALSVTLAASRSTTSTMVKLSRLGGLTLTHAEVAAMKDCIELLGDSADQLKRSVREMSRPGSKDHVRVMSDVQTWVSAAMTDEDTCLEGFSEDPIMESIVRGKIANVARLISNALTLVNAYASLRHE